MITMKVYDHKGGKNFLEIMPMNHEELMCIRYGHNKAPVYMSYAELAKVVGFLVSIRDNMPCIKHPETKDAITKI